MTWEGIGTMFPIVTSLPIVACLSVGAGLAFTWLALCTRRVVLVVSLKGGRL